MSESNEREQVEVSPGVFVDGPLRRVRVVTFDAFQIAWTDPSGALCIGRIGTASDRADVIYAPGTWDRAERVK